MHSQDVMSQLFAHLLGPHWAHLAKSGGYQSVIFNILATINIVAESALSALIAYGLSIGMVGTAHEGKAMGHLHTMWVPVRWAGAAALLAPVVKGLSIAQLGILSLTVASGALANQVWDHSLDFFAAHGGNFTISAPAGGSAGGESASPAMRADIVERMRPGARKLLRELVDVNFEIGQAGTVCQWASPADKNCNGNSVGKQEQNGWAWVSREQAAGTSEGQPAGWGYYIRSNMWPANTVFKQYDLGGVIVTCEKRTSQLCQNRREAMQTLQGSLARIALKIEQGNNPSPKKFNQALAAYAASVAPVIGSATGLTAKSYRDKLKTFVAHAKALGWAGAGMFYWDLALSQDKAARLSNLHPSVMPVNSIATQLRPSSQKDYNRAMRGLAVYENAIANSPEARTDMATTDFGLENAPDSGFMHNLANHFRHFFNMEGWFNGLVHHLSDSRDPIATLSTDSNYLVDSSVGMYAVWVGANTTAGAIKGAANSSGFVQDLIPFWNSAKGGVGGAIGGFMKGITPLFLTVVGLVFFPALIGAYYLPMIPFIVFTLAVIGFLFLVMEGLVGIAFAIVAMAIPTSDAGALGQAKTGLMLAMNIVIRPVLLITGYIFSIVIMGAVGWFVGETLIGFVSQTSDAFNRTFGLFTFIAMSIVLIGLFVYVAHKVFHFMMHITNNVPRWIGQMVQPISDSDPEAGNQHIMGIFGAYSRNAATGARPPRPSPIEPSDLAAGEQAEPGSPGGEGQEGKDTGGNGPGGKTPGGGQHLSEDLDMKNNAPGNGAGSPEGGKDGSPGGGDEGEDL